MTRPADPSRSRYISEPARVLRRIVAPAALELQGELPSLREENAALRDRLEQVEERVASLEKDALQDDAQRMAELRQQVEDLRAGLHEARRLNLRVAELTDLVTELVLPLHDRQIDPAVLGRLRADTL